jgi:hypothetical protein
MAVAWEKAGASTSTVELVRVQSDQMYTPIIALVTLINMA